MLKKWQIVCTLLFPLAGLCINDITLTDLYSFDSSFAEVSLHLDVDLYVANIAEDARTKVLLSIVPSSLEVTHKEKLINLHLIYRSSRTWPLSFSVCALIPTTFMAWRKEKTHFVCTI